MMQNQELYKQPFREQGQMADEPDTLDLGKMAIVMLRRWTWFVLSLIAALTCMAIYNRYTDTEYKVSTLLMIDKSSARQGIPLSIGSGISGNAFEGFGVMTDNRDFTANQMAILRSRPLVEKTITDLNIEISYYSKGRVKEAECYDLAPFAVIWDKTHPQLVDVDFRIEITQAGEFYVTASSELARVYSYSEQKVLRTISGFSIETHVQAGHEIATNDYAFTLFLNEYFNPRAINSYRIVFNPVGALADRYQSMLQVSPYDRESSVVIVSLRDKNAQKGIDFLNKLTETYIEDNLNKKNEIANRTIEFISSQLSSVSDSLWQSELRKQAFQSNRQVFNISYQTEQLLQQTKEFDNQRQMLETRNRYYAYLNEYMMVNKEPDNIIAPSAMGVDDPLLSALILQLNKLLVEKSSLISIRSSEHYKLRQINAQIESLKNSLIENTRSMLDQSEILTAGVDDQIAGIEKRMRAMPANERDYVNLERKYSLDSETYTFLLKKFSEAQIAKASNIPDIQVVERSEKGIAVRPLKRRNYLLALILGLIFPAGLIFLSEIFSSKVRSSEDIEAVTPLPVIGYLAQNSNNGSATHVLDNPNGTYAESYRRLRHKIGLLTRGKEDIVVAVTSSMPKEGKTTVAVNIASAFALMKKKTLLLDLDLRNSSLPEILPVNKSLGASSFLSGNAGLGDLSVSAVYPFLSVIPAGTPPDNPGEIFLGQGMSELITSLKREYDVIVIDIAPLGHVNDLFQIAGMLDATLFVVRHNFTSKEWLRNTLREVQINRIESVGLVVNGVNRKSFYNGMHSMGYL
jgi:tyrosine-protein kinase Etk/Wzc